MKIILNVGSTLGKKTGIGYYVTELMRAMRQHGRDVEIDTFPQGLLLRLNQIGSRVKQGVDADLASNSSLRQAVRNAADSVKKRILKTLREVNRVANKACFRLFQSKNGYSLYHEPNYVPYPIDLPTVVTVPDLSVLLHPEWHPYDRARYFERHFHKAVRSCSHFLTISEAVKGEMIRELGIPAEKITTTLLGARAELAPMPANEVQQELQRLNLPEKYFLCLGTIEPRKNVLMLMRAYCSLPTAIRAQYPLLLVGKWGWGTKPVAEHYNDRARFRGVRHLGYVPERAMTVLYNGARALLFPSHYEGFGLPPVEMMACGGAVIASKAEAVAEVAGEKAHLVDADDEEGWRTAMQRVATDDEWWRRLRDGAVEAASRFSWQRCAEQTLAVYRQTSLRAAA